MALPLGFKVYSTWSDAFSRSLSKGAPLQDVCAAVGCSSPQTFMWFYSLDIDSNPGSQVFLGQSFQLTTGFVHSVLHNFASQAFFRLTMRSVDWLHL